MAHPTEKTQFANLQKRQNSSNITGWQTSSPKIQRLLHSEVFVFGSNLIGRHGKGAALLAYGRFGAVWGKGWGKWGQTFAIPTKDERIQPLSVGAIGWFVKEFLKFAKLQPQWNFLVTEIGCGLAGNSVESIAKLFLQGGKLPSNVYLPASFHCVCDYEFNY